MDDRLFWFWFSTMLGISARTQHQLMDMFLHPREIFKLSPNIIEGKLSKNAYERFISTRDPQMIERTYKKIQKNQIQFLCWKDAAYPARLRKICDYPYGLFQKGRPFPEKKLMIAIVGSRHPTSYGIELAKKFSEEMAGDGIGVISGLAKGIDGAAHRGALAIPESTAGVLGCGIDRIYPRDNYQLFYDMYENQTVFSEYFPGTPPNPWNFPERNRLISGLSDGILVIEAKKKSGSLITADCGLEQNKEIFVVPGPVSNKNYEGSHGLIKQGAKLTETLEDILSEFPKLTKNSRKISQFNGKQLANPEKKVYDVVDLYPKHLNEIIVLTGLSFDKTVEALFYLESEGYIKQIHHNIYIKNLYKG